MMNETKKPFKFGFKKKDKSPMFQSASHYWNASQIDFLHSKGSANVELSIDPFNKKLVRIFCQSIDPMVNYKSMEFCSRTTVLQTIDKMIKILRLNKSVDQLVLVEAIGRCILLAKDGSTTKKLATRGQPSIFIEQNRRTLMNADYLLTVLNYWKPMVGFCRRFELCLVEKNHQMSSCDSINTESDLFLPFYNNHDSSSTISQKSNNDCDSKSTQTETQAAPPVVPRRRMSIKTPKTPHLLTLKGDESDDQNLMLVINSVLEFGSPGSNSAIILQEYHQYPDQNICVFSKTGLDSEESGVVFVENVCQIPDLLVTVNGIEVSDRVPLRSGDIISIGDYYSYFYKDLSMNSNQDIKIKHFLNSSTNRPLKISRLTNNHGFDGSDHGVTSSSISSCSDMNNSGSRVGKSRKKVSIDLHGISLACFDMALNQVLIHYFDERMDLTNAVTFGLYLIRFCREGTRCSFSLEKMQDRMRKRFCKSLEMALDNDCYLLGNLKLIAFTFQMWLVYRNENYFEATEENQNWLDFLESFTRESFEHLSSYICESAQNHCVCFWEENPLLMNNDETDDDIYTIDKFLNFLNETYKVISKIDCDRMSEVYKSVFTPKIVISITEPTVMQTLSDMKTFNWQKGVQISSQVEKFENWLIKEDIMNIYEKDGFLKDFSKLISTRVSLLKEMNWKRLRKNFSKVPVSVLSQFLSRLASNTNNSTSWMPSSNDVREANRDVVDVLRQYLQSADTFTLFQPGIILQTDCLPMDKLIQSVNFIAHCTVLDSELIGMGENFQWMSLPKPQSLVNFKNSRWAELRQSMGDENYSRYSVDNKNRSSILANGKPFTKKFQTDSDYSSISTKTDAQTPSKKLIARYLHLKGTMNNHSKSMVSLNETDNLPKPPRRKKNQGSFSNLNKSKESEIKSCYLSTDGSKSRESFGNKSCSGRIGRSESNVSDMSPPCVIDIDSDNSSCIDDVDQSIDHMERCLKNSALHVNKSLSPSIENGFEDDDDEMSVGLSASGLTNRLKSKSSDALLEIDEDKQIEVTLSKSPSESYGITLADGTQTNLKCEGIFIYKVKKFSPAESTGKIRPGDRILAINNYSVNELSFEECLLLITKSQNTVTLLIEKSDLKTTLGMMSVYQ